MSDVDQHPKPTPRLEVSSHPSFENSVRIRYLGYTAAYDIWWGDYKAKTVVPGDSTSYRTHVYDRPGAYTVQLFKPRSVKPEDFLVSATVVIRPGLKPIGIEWGASSEHPNLWEARFVDTEDGTGVIPRFRIEWPGDDTEEVWGVPGTSSSRFLESGEYDIKVTDLTSGRWEVTKQTVAGEQFDPDFTVAASPEQDAAKRTARVTFTKASKKVQIDWGDQTGWQTVESPKVGGTVDHTYAADGSYPVLVMYTDGTTTPPEGKTLDATVPYAAG